MLLGSLLPLGGTMGYLRRQSVASLVSGLATGAMYWFGWHLGRNANRPKEGNLVSLVTSILLCIVMLARFLASKKRVPLVICSVAGLSAVIFVAEVNALSP